MKSFKFLFFVLITLSSINILSQIKDYSVKYGLQAHFLQPRTEFDNDSYMLSLLGRGFLKIELTKFFEAEIGVGFGELNGQDFENENWVTNIYPSDLRIIFSPIASKNVNPYVYGGIGLLKWNLANLPLSHSLEQSNDNGWNVAIPLGGGFEAALGEETLLNVSAGYTFALTDDLNYYRKPAAKDGYFDFGVGLTFVMGSGLTDKDNDGLTEKFENSIGTDPNNNDSDGDKLFDGIEINTFKTDPLNKDTDNDGLNDYEEVIIHNTDPNSKDTDGDEISDFDEISKYNSNPILKDSDGDGLSDGYEIHKYNTNPAMDDTDNDSLKDNDEIQKYKTDPTKRDTDGDGLTDGEEINIFKTDPLLKDTDGNGIDDKKQYKPKKSPKIDKDFIINEVNFESSNPIVFEGITFELNKAKINPSSEPSLIKVYNALVADHELSIEIRGYTDNTGNTNSNKKLSQQRSDIVRIWLVKKGIDALRIQAKGFGEANPIADNSTKNGRILNRRIEFVKITE